MKNTDNFTTFSVKNDSEQSVEDLLQLGRLRQREYNLSIIHIGEYINAALHKFVSMRK